MNFKAFPVRLAKNTEPLKNIREVCASINHYIYTSYEGKSVSRLYSVLLRCTGKPEDFQEKKSSCNKISKAVKVPDL